MAKRICTQCGYITGGKDNFCIKCGGTMANYSIQIKGGYDVVTAGKDDSESYYRNIDADSDDISVKHLGNFVEIVNEKPLYSVRIKNVWSVLFKAFVLLAGFGTLTVCGVVEQEMWLAILGITVGILALAGLFYIEFCRRPGIRINVFENHFEILKNRLSIIFVPFESVTNIVANGKKGMKIQGFGTLRFIYIFNSKKDRNACYKVLATQTLKSKKIIYKSAEDKYYVQN